MKRLCRDCRYMDEEYLATHSDCPIGVDDELRYSSDLGDHGCEFSIRLLDLIKEYYELEYLLHEHASAIYSSIYLSEKEDLSLAKVSKARVDIMSKEFEKYRKLQFLAEKDKHGLLLNYLKQVEDNIVFDPLAKLLINKAKPN